MPETASRIKKMLILKPNSFVQVSQKWVVKWGMDTIKPQCLPAFFVATKVTNIFLHKPTVFLVCHLLIDSVYSMTSVCSLC